MWAENNKNTILVFRPTWTEFQNFSSYIKVMEKKGAHRAGLAKVIPPPEWIARRKRYDEDGIMNLKIPAPISQVVSGQPGYYQMRSVVKKSMTVLEYKSLAESDQCKTPKHFDYKDLETKFWRFILYNPPLFGCDVSGSITDNDVGVWNISKLGTILDYVNEDYGDRIDGVDTPYFYFGMWKSFFPWHTEDMDLYSINYIHEGHPKTWYSIPPDFGREFERLAKRYFPTEASNCPAFLRHKTTIITPSVLKQHSIPFNRITQERGEFIITFPSGYHSGFNHGFNIAESINFASPRWVNYGKTASLCHCRKNSVKICMDTFVKRIQPEQYKFFLQNNNIGANPKDTSGSLEAPSTSKSSGRKSIERKDKMWAENNKNTILVFRPTWTEFQNFSSYIKVMEKKGAHRAGLAKVIPPPEWIARRKRYDEDGIMNLKIPAPISQVVSGQPGYYQMRSVVKKSMTVLEYKSLAESDQCKTPKHFDYKDLETKFWRLILYNPPLYGCDVSGSITDNDVGVWNISKLGTILDYVNEDYGDRIEGVNTPYFYFGMWKSFFPWHTEDMDLYSINYIHEGHPKTWYSIPPDFGREFERLAKRYFPTEASNCPAFLRHKTTIITPSVLKQHSIPFNRITQERGEFIITFPSGYHSGFNHGFNIAESINFASPRWVNYGKTASLCHCRKNSVKICMDTFVKRIQPEQYKFFLQNNNIGANPKDTSGSLEAPSTSKSNILCNKNNVGTPKNNIKTGRKRRHVTLLSDSELPNDTTLTKPLLNLEKPRNSSLASSKPCMNSKNRPSDMKSILMTQTKRKKIDLESTQNLIQPTLEPIPMKEEKHEIDVSKAVYID